MGAIFKFIFGFPSSVTKGWRTNLHAVLNFVHIIINIGGVPRRAGRIG
jgi:hypothetical protein